MFGIFDRQVFTAEQFGQRVWNGLEGVVGVRGMDGRENGFARNGRNLVHGVTWTQKTRRLAGGQSMIVWLVDQSRHRAAEVRALHHQR
jgi:hypothetical protein